MMTATTTVASTDSDGAIAIVLAVAAGFFTVGAHYYFRLTTAAERLLVRRTKKRLQRSKQFLRVRRVGRLLALIDGVTVVGLRVSIAIPLALFWFVLVPLFLTIGSIALAASIVRF